MRPSRSVLVLTVACTLWLSALATTCWQPLRALFGTQTLRRLSTEDLTQANAFSLRREIQKHFLSLNIYLPMDDIIVANEHEQTNETLIFLMRKGCGNAKLYVWIPLRFRLPFYGTETMEWCWKPNVTKN